MLLVLGPREKFSPGETARLEQLVLAGVPTAFFLDSRDVNMESGAFFAAPLDTGLERVMSNWGVALKKSFVLDAQNQNISIQQQAGPYVINNIVSYPLLPIVTQLSRENPITKELDQLAFPFASPVSTQGVKGARLEVLAQTTRLSWMKNDLVSLSPYADLSASPQDPKGPFPVAVFLEGKLPALYAAPPDDIVKSTPLVSGVWSKESNGVSRILVAGTSRMIDRNIGGEPSGAIFFLNTIDVLSEDPDLVSVRSKGAKLRPFTVALGEVARQLVKWSSVVVMPVLVIILAFLVFARRRRWKAGLRARLLEVQESPA